MNGKPKPVSDYSLGEPPGDGKVVLKVCLRHPDMIDFWIHPHLAAQMSAPLIEEIVANLRDFLTGLVRQRG